MAMKGVMNFVASVSVLYIEYNNIYIPNDTEWNQRFFLRIRGCSLTLVLLHHCIHKWINMFHNLLTVTISSIYLVYCSALQENIFF